MASENPFRVAVVVVIFLTIAVTLYYRLRAAASARRSLESRRLPVCRDPQTVRAVPVHRTLTWVIAPAAVQWATIPLSPKCDGSEWSPESVARC